MVEATWDAQATLGVTDDLVAMYLALPVRAGVAGPFLFAVSPERDDRMHRLVAMARSFQSRPSTVEHKDRLL